MARATWETGVRRNSDEGDFIGFAIGLGVFGTVCALLLPDETWTADSLGSQEAVEEMRRRYLEDT